MTPYWERRYVRPRGSLKSPLAIVGEAPGNDEEIKGEVFVGPSGKELEKQFSLAGIGLAGAYFTNVLSRRPGRDVKEVCTEKNDASYLPSLEPGKYFPRSIIEPELERLYGELKQMDNLKVILALGNTACWALLGETGIKSLRGKFFHIDLNDHQPLVFPTYHPAAVLRQWSFRATTILDLQKVQRALSGRDISPPNREIWTRPTLNDLEEFEPYLHRASIVGVDCETKNGLVDCWGFSADETRAIVVPFWNGGNEPYWPDEKSELQARRWCNKIIEDPSIPKVMQNGMYDYMHALREGAAFQGWIHDTMLLHHAIYPELEKSLEFLASIYTNERHWKDLNANEQRWSK